MLAVMRQDLDKEIYYEYVSLYRNRKTGDYICVPDSLFIDFHSGINAEDDFELVYDGISQPDVRFAVRTGRKSRRGLKRRGLWVSL